MTQTTGAQRSSEQADAIRPFQKVNFPEEELTELRRRIKATKWPERETVADASQGGSLRRFRRWRVHRSADVLDNITLTWLTNTALSGARLYWENKGYSFFGVRGVVVPTAVSVFQADTVS